MTKVRISPSLLLYRQAMANTVEQVRREQTIAGVEPCVHEAGIPPLPDVISCEPCMAGLLKPPRIESLQVDFWIRHEQLNGLVQVWTSGYFGILNAYVIISDDRGNVVDSDYALRSDFYMNHWAFILETDVDNICSPDICSLTVQAIVTDCLGGTGVQNESTMFR